MFTNAILPDTLRAIKLISEIPTIQKAYLAGGTALALQIGHRISVDLDFFTQEKFDENVLELELKEIDQWKFEGKAWRTVWGQVGKTKLSIFYYEYRVIKKLLSFAEINILSKPDIAAMKIHAIETRGTKRDFIDLFFLVKEFPMEKILEFYDKKFANLEDHLYAIIRSLAYFEDAEMDEISPQMLVDMSWDDVKQFFKQESIRLAQEKLRVEK
jgi:predicted nucleotidyltransferase component of viral defense system